MSDTVFNTLPLPETVSESLELLAQLLQSACRMVQVNIEAGEIKTWCTLEPGEPLVVGQEPDFKTLFDKIELETVYAKDRDQVPATVLTALQLLSSDGFKASFWVADKNLDLKRLMGWPSLTSISRGFLGLPLYRTDDMEFSNKLVVFGTRLQDSTLHNAQAGIAIILQEVSR